MRRLTAPIMSALVAHSCLAALYYPTPQASFLEHILVDNWGAYASNFSSAITPCSNYVTQVGEPALNSGRTTAAQWMRVAFHDFVTADGGFPDVVPESAVTPNNTNGVVHEYIDWTGSKGGPLVTTENITTRSDLRLYESDGNDTMQALYDIGDEFLNTCVDLMGRMIHTVPANVELGPPLEPMGIKPVNVTFDIDGQGHFVLSGKIRILDKSSATALPLQASIVASDGASESLTLEPEPTTGSSVYGQTIYYSFSAAVRQDVAYTALEVSQDGACCSQISFPLQSSIFVVPNKTSVEGSRVDFALAAKSDLSSVKVNVSAPARQQGTLAPKITRYTADVRRATSSALIVPGYQVWEGSVDLGAPPTGAVAVAVTAMDEGGEAVRDVLYLSAGAAGW
ncbi:hypothetical protein KVR01_008266 [Diaporthe batatas]|uniref:uncharacterized protein n=1 Tax=Diaporthe batatas TaxID=748121 RepID=UPI001D043068|nr:uncharacterized protein KVR01_008266 [Diaporthe batatas]KAG8162501.1 hypothetical protein KVR01_008266 [Diaporthe batatas]